MSTPNLDPTGPPAAPPPPADLEPGRRARRAVLAALAALGGLGVVVALGVGLITGTGRYGVGAPDDRNASAMAPMVAPDGVLDLASVPPAIAAEFRYAADHARDYTQLRCWCGCESAFAHTRLLDCFVRPDGSWEAHGAGCAVCIAEAATARARLDDGVPIAEIAAELDAEYGPASIPTPEPAEDTKP